MATIDKKWKWAAKDVGRTDSTQSGQEVYLFKTKPKLCELDGVWGGKPDGGYIDRLDVTGIFDIPGSYKKSLHRRVGDTFKRVKK